MDGSLVDGAILSDADFGSMINVGSSSFGAEGQAGMEIPPGESDAESIFISVSVPEEAKVVVNKKPTVSEGKTRHFVIRALEPGKKYKFEIRAEMVNVWGIPLVDTKTVTLTPGTREQVTMIPVRIRKKSAEPTKAPDAKTEGKAKPEEDSADKPAGAAPAPEEVKPATTAKPKAKAYQAASKSKK